MKKASLGVLLLSCVVASGSPITYTEQVVGAGSLGKSTFTNTLVTFVLEGDTSNIYSDAPGVFRNLGTATVTVAGIGAATFTDEMGFAAIQAWPLAGIFDHTMADFGLLSTIDPSLATYSLGTAIGPVSSQAFWAPLSFPTTDGVFILNGTAAGISTFSATTVPEPASVALLSIGFASLIGCRCRRKRDAAERRITRQ